MKFGLGYQPYSSKKYSVVKSEVLADGAEKAELFRGEGTLSTVQAAVSYQVSPEFALGLRSNFYFGNKISSKFKSFKSIFVYSRKESFRFFKKIHN